MNCVDTIARYLLYAFLIDFSLEMLDLIHRIYEADESFKSLDFMVHTKLYTSQIVIQIFLGTLVPLFLLGLTQVVRLTEAARKGIYFFAGLLTLIGIFAMRWNVVIGGQLFSKSFLGYTTYKLGFATREGLLPSILLMLLPFGILWVLIKLLPPWRRKKSDPDLDQSDCAWVGTVRIRWDRLLSRGRRHERSAEIASQAASNLSMNDDQEPSARSTLPLETAVIDAGRNREPASSLPSQYDAFAALPTVPLKRSPNPGPPRPKTARRPSRLPGEGNTRSLPPVAAPDSGSMRSISGAESDRRTNPSGTGTEATGASSWHGGVSTRVCPATRAPHGTPTQAPSHP